MALTTTTEALQTLLQRQLSDWQAQLQIWAASRALVDAATEALVLETVPASLKDLNGRLATGDWSDIPRVELLLIVQANVSYTAPFQFSHSDDHLNMYLAS
jgi:hypothetical protein